MEDLPPSLVSSLALESGEGILDAWHVWFFEPAGGRRGTNVVDGYLVLTSRKLMFGRNRAVWGEDYRVLPWVTTKLEDIRGIGAASRDLVVNGWRFRPYEMRGPDALSMGSVVDRIKEAASGAQAGGLAAVSRAKSGVGATPVSSEASDPLVEAVLSGQPGQVVTCPGCKALTPSDGLRCKKCGTELPDE